MDTVNTLISMGSLPVRLIKLFAGVHHMSHNTKKRSSGFPTRSDTNQAAQLQKMARGLKFLLDM